MPDRPTDWDATAYDRVADPQEEWGREVLERLDLRGDETVLDAGCGSGRVTRLLAERLPRGRLIAIDASASMVAMARQALADSPCRSVHVLEADLGSLELAERVDAVFSNATFHWLLNHTSLFERLAAVLIPGGRLEAQWGGEGNVAEFTRAVESLLGDERFAPYMRNATRPWNFASIADTEDRLRVAGFEVDRIWTEDRPVTPADPQAYLRAVGFGSVLRDVPAEVADRFVAAVTGSMTQPLVLDYVRINVSAGRL
ncbi:MAG: methyltransferase domain-containing protein [Solirubrobacterales bacterium]|nr:methyltransferase domain-containing protein [Solirubrobacterales bacterium]